MDRDANLVNDNNGSEDDYVEHSFNRPISKEEVLLALRKIKQGKAAGPDSIIGEIIKHACSSHSVLQYFIKLFNYLFDRGVYPSCWTESIVIPLYKKGDINDTNNYRGISLSNITSKLFSTIINSRLQEWVTENNITGEYQAGFKQNYSTIDHVFTLMAFVQKQFGAKS